MKQQLVLLFLLFSCANIFAQDYNETFKTLCQDGKLLEAEEHLLAWKKASPEDPEMLIGFFNYYLAKSREKLGEEQFFLGDNIIAISKDSVVDVQKILKQQKEKDSLFAIAQDYLNKGIALHPNRLDMYLGQSNTYQKHHDKEKYIQSIIAVVKQNTINDGKWLWTDNVPEEFPEMKFVNMVQWHINFLFQEKQPRIEDILNITEILLNKYPNNYILLSNVGLCMLELGHYNVAIPYFEKGIQSNPKDMILRFNLADAYVQIKDLAKAKAIYQYIIENGEQQYADYAKGILKKIEE